jgi:outer membrane lipoprotein-sorting protein
MRLLVLCSIFWLWILPTESVAAPEDARSLVARAQQYYRGQASVAVMKMTIHRPGWERMLTIKAWTKGQRDAIFFIAAPAKDEGNGTLRKGREVWTYNPKVDRVIKLPPAMMAQSWMGSDFSNEDLSKSDSIVDDYVHTVEASEIDDGKKVSVIRSVPKPGLPIVWGLQRLRIREDLILLGEAFYDEDLQLVKTMTSSHIEVFGGRLFPSVWVIEKADAEGGFTRVEYESLAFRDTLPDSLFTLTALKNPWR